ncbi:MAG TPA: hypothetical protein PLM22_10325 [Candidatus Sabulitectum sp.]|nr:hypothetical protein [Candidatus Sabulitectum sp.]HPF31739.1 hypothetical protein [Candidatus Sabulitectum sp.]HPJ29320.1 hypothetical protein [Candidatus Sabulitectum sp.]HPR22520.1 hypothetical protein [Candidatus Sabulitectum sp.]
MRITYAILAVLAIAAAGEYIEVGSLDYPVNRPFCGDCNQSLRQQVLVPADSMGTAMDIDAVAFLVSEGETVSFDRFTIHMGITGQSSLSEGFESNWMPGTKTLVYDHEFVTYTSPGVGQWMEIALDTPFWYNGEDNLLVEFGWPGGTEVIMIWAWVAPDNYTCYAGWEEPQGNLLLESLVLRFSGALELYADTFAGIKSTLGGY